MDSKYIESFIRGKLYLSSLTHFSAIEEPSRSDWFEGKYIATKKDINNIGLPQDLLNVLDNLWYEEKEQVPYFKLLCLYGLICDNTSGMVVKPDCRLLKDFGDKTVIFSDFPEFKERFKTALDKKYGLNYYADDQPVLYRKNVYKSSLADHLFRKREDYSWQNELRIAVRIKDRQDFEPFEIDIGDIQDITRVVLTAEFIKYEHISEITCNGICKVVEWDENALETRNNKQRVSSVIGFTV
jgi:hypothetical protein